VLAGKAGAEYKENNAHVQVSYEDLFDASKTLEVPGAGNWSYYPNRDSYKYISLYNLSDAHTFIRTTLRHPAFFAGLEKYC